MRDLAAVLANDRARIAADERVTAEMFAAFDRFKKERLALPANFQISGERRFEIREQTPRDRHKIALRGQFQEFVQFGCVHTARRIYISGAAKTPYRKNAKEEHSDRVTRDARADRERNRTLVRHAHDPDADDASQKTLR